MAPRSILALTIVLAAWPDLASAQEPARPDWLSFANGAIPLSIGGAGAEQGAGFEHAIRIVDGDPRGFTIVNQATGETDTEFVYELPALTTFDRFAVPDVLETPSPSQTFTRLVEVYGSTGSPEGPWTRLASGTLTTHGQRGQVTELDIEAGTPVRWVRLRLVGGIQMLRDAMFLEFGEIIGNGTQEPTPLSDRFTGQWRARGVRLELHQEGATVTGCFDQTGDLEGTVTGSLLRATGAARSSGVVSAFILNVADDGTLRGLASTNGAPFRIYTAPPAPAGTATECAEPAEPPLGCGSIIHGITFDFDSDVIRPDAEPVLAALFAALRDDPSSAIVVEGHTSSEGEDAYNLALSERRARAVVADLVARGLDPARVTAAGRGETDPIAPNTDEAGRSLNRRVEVECG